MQFPEYKGVADKLSSVEGVAVVPTIISETMLEILHFAHYVSFQRLTYLVLLDGYSCGK